jgi:4'-phosphopantetheinyl transferase
VPDLAVSLVDPSFVRKETCSRHSLPRFGCIDLWHLRADHHPYSASLPASILSPQEMDRVRRFARQEDRQRYWFRQSALRKILASYLSVPAPDLRFVVGQYGKPSLDTAQISFNTSSSGDEAVLAVASHGAVGVDIQPVRADIDWRAIAAVAFHPLEVEWIDAQENQISAFSLIWTRREALFKAWGKGLHDNMSRTSVVSDDQLSSKVFDPDGGTWFVATVDGPFAVHVALATSFEVVEVRSAIYAAAGVS